MPTIRIDTLALSAVARQAMGKLTIHTNGRGFSDMTAPIIRWVAAHNFDNGLLTVFCPHTSASLVLQENTDPDAQQDIIDALEVLAPRGLGYRHDTEGPDDMPAHIKTVLTASSITIPIMNSRPVIGIWQAIYLIEHRDRPHERNLFVHCIGN